MFVLITECKTLGVPTIQKVLDKWLLAFYCCLHLISSTCMGSVPRESTSLTADPGFPFLYSNLSWCSPNSSTGKELLAMQETPVLFLGWGDPLEKG